MIACQRRNIVKTNSVLSIVSVARLSSVDVLNVLNVNLNSTDCLSAWPAIARCDMSGGSDICEEDQQQGLTFEPDLY